MTKKLVTHRITSNVPFRFWPNKYNKDNMNMIRDSVEKMLASGVIRERTSRRLTVRFCDHSEEKW